VRRTANRSELDPIDIELDEAEAGYDPPAVASKPSAGRSVGLVVLGVVVGVLVTLTVTRDERPAGPTAATATTMTTTRPSPSTIGSTIVTAPSTVASAPTLPTLPARPLGHETGIVLYLTPDGGAPDGLIAYDVDRGQIHRIELRTDVGWYIRAIDGAGGVVVDGGRVVGVAHGQLTLFDVGGQNGFDAAPVGRVAPGLKGGLWLRRSDPAEIDLLDAAGMSTGVRLALPSGSDLYGSMADGLPVVRSDDGRVFVVGLDGQRTLLAANALDPVEAGRFAETRCDILQQCHLIAHIGDQEVDLGSNRSADGTVRQVRFQPGGPLVAVFDYTQLSLIDTVSSEITNVVTNFNPSPFGGGNSPVQFLPDGAGLVVSTRNGLQFLDLTGKTLANVALEPASMPGPILLGVGQAVPWQVP
jgi:hypothetical protein